jgi:hypothetical protein
MHKRRNRTRLLTPAQEKPNKHGLNIASNEVNYYNNLIIDQEIECPSCHDIMTLYYDFDELCYVCEECTFLLRINRCEL